MTVSLKASPCPFYGSTSAQATVLKCIQVHMIQEEKKTVFIRAINCEKYNLFKIEVGLHFRKSLLKEKLGVQALGSACQQKPDGGLASSDENPSSIFGEHRELYASI